MTTSTRLRVDLRASAVEDADGVLYYDVSDPKTGSTLRLFDFEWLLAQRLDGQHSFDELARWTESQLGFVTSRGDLEIYADRLQQLGLLDIVQVTAPTPVSKPPAPTPPAPTPAVVQAAPLPPPPAQTAPAREPPRPTPAPVEPRQPEELRPTPSGADLDDGLMGRPVISLPASRIQQPVAAKPATPPVEAKPAKPEPPVVSRSPLRDAIDSLPAPAETPAPPVAPPPPVRSELQTAAAEASALGASPAAEPPVAAADLGSQQTPVRAPTETPAAPPPVIEATKPVAPPAVQLPVIEVVKPEPATIKAPVVEAPKPAEPATIKAPVLEVAKPAPQTGGGSGKWIFLVLLLLCGIGAAYYFLVYLPQANPPALSVQLVAANPSDLPRTFPGPAEVKKAEPQSIKVDVDGTVVDIKAEGAEVAADAPLVVLESKEKLEKEQGDIKVQLEKLQKKFDSAKGKAKQTAQTQLTERQARQTEVESLLKKASVLAARPGIVTKVVAKVGQAVTAGTEVLTLADKAMVAELKVPALEGQGMKQGQDVKLLTSGADPSSLPAQLISLKTEGESATLVLSLPLDTSAKVGDKLSLQLGMLEKVVRLPASALVEGNKVYLSQNGKAALRQVTVANRDNDSVMVQGLMSGDQVITNPSPTLHEGAAVQAAAH